MGDNKASLMKSITLGHDSANVHVFFGATATTVLALVALVLVMLGSGLGAIVLMVAAWLLILLMWSPASFKRIYGWWKMLWLGVGQAVIMLVWLLYILPSGLLMQARGKDPLDLRFDPANRTYWKKPHPTGNMQKVG